MIQIGQNPIILKELRGRMRGNRAFILLTFYVTVLSLILGLLFLIYSSSQSGIGAVNERQAFGKAVFGVVLGLELIMVSFVAPSLTAGSISGEREHQTFDILRTTLLPARSLVMGKFISGLCFLLLLLLVAVPLQSLAFLFGGVEIPEVAIGTLLLIVSAFTFCAAGTFFSSLSNRTLVSTVLTYGFSTLSVFALPILLFFAALFLDGFLGGFNDPNRARFEAILYFLGWLAVSVNPMATGITSEILLQDQGKLFLFDVTLSNGGQFTLVSPWIIFVIVYLLLSLVLLWLSVRFVRRAEK